MREATLGLAASVVEPNSAISFIERMTVCCDHLICQWLQNREVWTSVPAAIRSRIVDTVRQLFLKRVYPETPLKRIAQIARVTEGSICRLFGNRALLNEYVLRDTHERIMDVTRRLLSERNLTEVTLAEVAQAMNLPRMSSLFCFLRVKRCWSTCCVLVAKHHDRSQRRSVKLLLSKGQRLEGENISAST